MTVYNGVFREFLESARQRTVLSSKMDMEDYSLRVSMRGGTTVQAHKNTHSDRLAFRQKEEKGRS